MEEKRARTQANVQKNSSLLGKNFIYFREKYFSRRISLFCQREEEEGRRRFPPFCRIESYPTVVLVPKLESVHASRNYKIFRRGSQSRNTASENFVLFLFLRVPLETDPYDGNTYLDLVTWGM